MGFTLIELLVVISIISLLSSITWASINTAREKAQQSKILAEIHETKNSVGKNYEDRTYELGTNLDHYFTVDKGTYAPDVLGFGGGIVPSPFLAIHPDIIFTMSSGCPTCSAEKIFYLYQNKWLGQGFGFTDFSLTPFQKYIVIRKGTEAGGSYPTKLTLPDNVTYWGSTPWNGGPRPWP